MAGELEGVQSVPRLLAGGDRVGGGLLRQTGYYALQQAFNRIHVMMDWPDLAGEPAGSTFRRAIYVVNDYATAYPSLTVIWQVRDLRDEVLAAESNTCAAPAISLQQVGEAFWDIPSSGRYRVSLTLKRHQASPFQQTTTW